MKVCEYKQILSDSGHFFDALLNETSGLAVRSRFHDVAHAFIGIPYALGALGEGAGSGFDQFPRYRSDVVDCVTLINTLLALLISDSLGDFKKHMMNLSYLRGEVSYINRFHFTASQWNVAHASCGILSDITSCLSSLLPGDVLRHSCIQIDSRAWYASKTISDVRLLGDATNADKQCCLDHLLESTKSLCPLESQISFIAFDALFSLSQEERHIFYAAIPFGVIVEIVRKRWDIEASIGTPLHVCHMGLIRDIEGEVCCQHASSTHGQVMIESCDAFFQSWFELDSLSGVNFQKIMVDGLA